MSAGREDERIGPVPSRAANGQSILLGHLIVHACEETLLIVLVWNREALSGKSRRRRKIGARLTLVLVRNEKVCLVLDDRSADRAADLLIGVRQHAIGDGVGRIQLVVAEESVHAAARRVRARACDRLHLDACRAPFCDVEQVRHNLELRARIARGRARISRSAIASTSMARPRRSEPSGAVVAAIAGGWSVSP